MNRLIAKTDSKSRLVPSDRTRDVDDSSRRQRKATVRFATLATAIVFSMEFSSAVSAAQVRLQMGTSEGPHYVGEVAIIQFVITGLEREAEPKVEYESITPGLRARLTSVNPQISESITNFNGRVNRQKSIAYKIRYQLSADEPGDYSIGPFDVSIDGISLKGQQVSFTFQGVEEDPDMRIRQILPEKPIYPGQRANVGIEWWYLRDQANDVFPPRISSLLFDQFDFIDATPGRNQPLLPIATTDGQVKLAADVREETIDGKQFVVVSAQRTLVADRPGEYELPPITASIKKVTKWQRERGFFGRIRNVPIEKKPMRAVGEKQQLMVKPLPSEGRPESFAGAVGDSFSIDVGANRTVVRVGDPITLKIALRGVGNLRNASLPSLSADGGGLRPELFRLPDGDIAGDFDGQQKTFELDVRVKQEGVREIPALAYSWFDPNSETYKTALSKPIALSVGEAKVVAASDVVSSVESTSDDRPDPAPKVSNSVGNNTTASEDVGADLSIASDVSVLRSSSTGWAIWLQAVLYLGGLLAVAVAVWDRRRNDVDPAVANRRRTLRQQRQKIVAASSLPRQEAARQIADALRTLIAEMPDARRDSAERLIAQCESIVYEPDVTGGDRIDAALVADATSTADQFSKDAE